MVTWTKQKKLKQKRIHLSQQVSQNGKLFSDSIPVTYTDIHPHIGNLWQNSFNCGLTNE